MPAATTLSWSSFSSLLQSKGTPSHSTGLGSCTLIRTKLEVDREALRGWPGERLESVGVKLETVDEFFVELKQEALQNAA